MDDAAPFDPGARAREIIGEAPAISDDALALAFSVRHEGKLLYVAAQRAWLKHEDGRWKPDNVQAVIDLVRTVCREAAASEDSNRAVRLASAGTIRAVERLAQSDPRHARSIEQFDADPWSLNTPGGVVNLRTGAIEPHRHDDLHMKVAAVTPGGHCPRWLRFLLQITHRDKALVRYLQRFIGYTLTGTTKEHAFVFLRGPGGNGKSVLLGTVAAALGDYATTAMPDVVTVGRNEQHPTHLASLRGARMVLVTETEEGRPWAEARLKALVAGDTVSARVMRGNLFEFKPTGKWWIAGNHSPVLRNPDPAMQRRLNIVPLTFVPTKADPDLAQSLKAELPGILAWAIRGCLAWLNEGLNPPAIVKEASAEYFADQDSIATWLTERCERVAGARAQSNVLFDDWEKWTAERGEQAGTRKAFSVALERHVEKKKTAAAMMFLGLRLRGEAPADGATECQDAG